MNLPDWINTTTLLYALGLVLLGVLALSLTLVAWVLWNIRRINLPPGADAVTALRATPLVVVVVLDLLDLSLDIFSAPITWALLTRLGLAPLRWVAVIKDLIPISQFIPAMTVAWLIVHVSGQKRTLAPPTVISPPLLNPPSSRSRH